MVVAKRYEWRTWCLVEKGSPKRPHVVSPSPELHVPRLICFQIKVKIGVCNPLGRSRCTTKPGSATSGRTTPAEGLWWRSKTPILPSCWHITMLLVVICPPPRGQMLGCAFGYLHPGQQNRIGIRSKFVRILSTRQSIPKYK